MAEEMKPLHQPVQVDGTPNQSGLHLENREFNQGVYAKQELTYKHTPALKYLKADVVRSFT